MFENWNSLGIYTGQQKVAKMDYLRKRYNVDTILGCETQCDWRHADSDSQFKNLFGLGEAKKVCVGHNVTGDKKTAVRDQKGGTAMGTFGRMSAQVADSEADYTGLGRWSSQLIGKGEIKTRVVVAYQPCEKRPNSKGFTVFE